MRHHPLRRVPFLLLLTALLLAAGCGAPRVTTPEEAFGSPVGADYVLIDYAQLKGYWETLDRESDRLVVQSIGKTSEGRDQLMAIITSPANHRRLDHYREIAARMARAEGIDETQALRLAAEGKAVVWIDGGLHATEVVGAQQLLELVYRMTSADDAETRRILDDVILLVVPANPDGMDLVSDWYMRSPVPEERTTRGLPVLYQKYAGHDNNRDQYMVNLVETENMNRVMYREWFPQIVYNHHQSGPAGTVLFAPPYRDPPNQNLDPLVITGIEQVGTAMHQRFVQEGKGGSTMRSGASYSTWWNGGQRTTPYFHNMIGLLTEIIGSPTPMEIPYLPNRQISRNDLPLPVEPGTWHMRQSIEYCMTADLAVLDYASRHHDQMLFNIWRMGANQIGRGSRDAWTVTAHRIDAEQSRLERGRGNREDWEAGLRRPDDRDPRGYIIPSDQPDFPTATKFVNTLIKNGVEVHRARSAFQVAGRDYPAGSYVVYTAQAFRPHVLDMFEPQDHPDDFAYPGAPPPPPYDSAGWTLAYQMGVVFDRMLEGFDEPFEKLPDLAPIPTGAVRDASGARGFLLSHQVNDAVVALNRLLRGGKEVYWLTGGTRVDGRSWPEGTYWIPAADGVTDLLSGLAADRGLIFQGVTQAPAGPALRLERPRIGLWDQYGGSMPSGWIRYLLESFEFDFDLVFPPRLDRGELRADYDVLIFPDGAVPLQERGGRGGFGGMGGPGGGGPETAQPEIPAQYQGRQGSVTLTTTVPQILRFIREGGAVIALGSSTSLGYHAGLPIRDHLVDPSTGRGLRSQDYYIPGSVLDVLLEHISHLLHGLGDRLDVMFNNDPVFTLLPGASGRGVRRVGWFDSAAPLRSGWAWGQQALKDGTAFLEAEVGQGHLFLFGPDITFRAQTHGAYPLLFNGIFYGSARAVRLP